MHVKCYILECTDVPDIIFIMDASGSIHEDRFVLAMDFLKGIAQDLPLYPDGQASFIAFSDRSTRYFEFYDFTAKAQVK